jgi:tripartite-type tricarboxylate transporter receptor subunit TctC
MGRDLQRSIVDRRAFTFGLIGAATLPSVGRAQAFPARPIQIIVPNAAGGVNDVLARIVALKLQDQFDKPVVVENRPGAGGDIGTEGVLKAEPDGHTLVMGSISLTLKPALYKTLRFDPRRDATSIARLAAQPMIIVSRPDFPANTFPEFIELAKQNPGKFTFGTPGPGTPQHFGAEMLCAEAGLKMIHVPYRGAVPAMTDIMANQIDIYYATETSGGAHMKAGRMKPLVVTSENRMAAFPELKTLQEYGYSKSTIGIWYGLFGPPRIPEAILGRLSSELIKMSQGDDYRNRLVKMGLDNAMSTPEVMRLQIETEIPIWQQVARAAGVKQEE